MSSEGHTDGRRVSSTSSHGALNRTFKHVIIIAETPAQPAGKKKLGGPRVGESYEPVRFAAAAHRLRQHAATLLLADSQDKTARIIAGYVKEGESPGVAPTPLTDHQKCLEQVLMTVPCLNVANARLLSIQFSSLERILSSGAELINRYGGMTRLNTALFIKYCKTNISSEH